MKVDKIMPKKSINYGKTINNKKRKRDPRFDWRTMFLQHSGGLSSKRICGILAWMLCLGIFLSGFIMDKEIPEYGEIIAIIAASLLGIDSITGIWQKNISK